MSERTLDKEHARLHKSRVMIQSFHALLREREIEKQYTLKE